MKKQAIFFLILNFLTISFFVNAQFYSSKDLNNLKNRKALVFLNDTTFEVELAELHLKKNTDRSKYYTWYKQKEIWFTQGVYDGSLLHGNYKKFDPLHQLRTKGNYRYGLKHGKWFYLNENGSLLKFECWHRGDLKSYKLFQEIIKSKSKLAKTTKHLKNKEAKKQAQIRTNYLPKDSLNLLDEPKIGIYK